MSPTCPRDRSVRRAPRALGALLAAALLGVWAAGPGAPPSSAKGGAALPPAGPPRVVLVLAGGGVRARDLLDGARHPALKALAADGVTVTEVATPRRTPWLAACDLLTGRGDAPDQDGKPRPAAPTLFEHLRAAGAAPEQVWFVCGPPGDDERLAWSEQPGYGASVGARVAAGLGAFGEPLRSFLDDVGRPLPVPDSVWPLLRRLRAQNRGTAGAFLPDDVDAGTPEAERVERAVLAELDRRSQLVRAESVEDERALRAALTVLAVERPRLLVVRLTGAEAAVESVARYEAVLAEWDRGLARLRAAVAADPVLAASTTVVLASETGRNARPNAQGGLPADDDSPDRRTAVVLLAGPGVKPGASVKGPRTLAEVGPTLARLLGVPFPTASARSWDEILRLR